ncbi:M18 family aminopeptidase [Agrococcus casei]|uniref:M18 family aminopeptidase n=1 Tax=Microbacteriaceae TaxID=85023 RepID=UPI003F8E8EC4
MTHMPDLNTYIQQISDFVSASPSSYHAARETERQLIEAGYEALDETAAWPELTPGAKHVVVRDGAVIAWAVGPDITPSARLNIFGAHTDSPGFKLKPSPAFDAEGWAQAGVEIYGGPLLNSWLDRDLAFAGRLITRDGQELTAKTGAVARIPQLAIHLDRQVNEGLKLQKQMNTQPVLGVSLGYGEGDPLRLLAVDAGIDAADIAGCDVVVADTQAPARIGIGGELLASGRLDNLSSTYAGLAAMKGAQPAENSIAVFVSFDHEEIGSETRSGASGPFLAEIVDRLYALLGAGVEERARGLASSWCLSADAGHSVHPNYRERHDPNVRPLAGQGPMLKVNAQQRYASDAHGAALWSSVCERAGVKHQTFVSNNDMPCGTTIGPLTATRLGIRTVDIGVPLLSMHSARELAHVDDLYALALVAQTFFA